MDRFTLLLDDAPGGAFAGPGLAINPAPSPVLGRFGALEAIQPDVVLAQQLTAGGIRVADAATAPCDFVLLRLGRSRDEAQGWVAQAWEALTPGGPIAISGAKTDGVDALAKALRKAGLEIDVRPKAHGKLIELRKTPGQPEIFETWAKAAAPQQNADGFWTVPGVFSPGAVDRGTALLIAHLPADISGDVLDLGAGWGALSAHLCKTCPQMTRITLVEADARALAMARRNVADPRAAFHWADATDASGLPSAVRTVVMNPPFHEGRAGTPGLGVSFIKAAAASLHGRGQLLMVANRHLPYEKTLDTCFGAIERLADDGKFKVIRATRPQTRKRR